MDQPVPASELAQTLAELAAAYARPGPADEAPQPPYRPDPKGVARLREGLAEALALRPGERRDRPPKLHLLLFSAFWCGDCRRQVPRLARVLKAALTEGEKGSAGQRVRLDIVKVPVGKADPTGRLKRRSVTNLPTLVILRGRRELGRVVERPAEGWEAALTGILESFT